MAGFSNMIIEVTDSAYPESQGADRAISIRILSEPLVVPGDIDGNGAVGLEDAIVGLKILSGIEVENVAVRNTLTGRVGLGDVIFVLKTIMDTD